MKKITKVFTLLLVVIFAISCSSDGNGEPNIYRKWYCTEVIQNGNSEAYNSNACKGFYIEFYDFNKYHIIETENCGKKIIIEGTFTKNENTIAVTGFNYTTNSQSIDTYTITELTKYNLTMSFGDGLYASPTGELLPALVLKYNR